MCKEKHKAMDEHANYTEKEPILLGIKPRMILLLADSAFHHNDFRFIL